VSGHTPGPWKVIAEGPWVCGPVGETVCLMQYISGTPTPTPANARLIAAAPELLEACKAMVRATDISAQKEALDYLYAVIAKAEGR
jgi:hypothetical protein